MEYKIVKGYYHAQKLPQIGDTVARALAEGWVPWGTPVVTHPGCVWQPMVKDPTRVITKYQIIEGFIDGARSPALSMPDGWTPHGDTVHVGNGYLLQACVQ